MKYTQINIYGQYYWKLTMTSSMTP